MAASSRGVIGGLVVLAIVFLGPACSSRDEPGAKGGAVQDATLPAPKPQLTVGLGGGVTMELVLIPPGTFDMGWHTGLENEEPVHKVTLKKAFYLGKYEVTQEQWQAIMGANPSHFKGPKKPVDSVNWKDCRDFVAKLSKKTGRKLALPSEAEWEYACRAGSTTMFCYGSGQAGLGEYAWYDGNSEKTTHPVGQKKPNQFGLFDMHGNVLEWCEDIYFKSYKGAPADGSAWLEGGEQEKQFGRVLFKDFRVLRGGSWKDAPAGCRSAIRLRYFPEIEGWDNVGCRVVLRDF